MSFVQKLKYLSKQRSIKYGVPFLILIVGGSFGLKEFSQLRYQFSQKQPVSPEDMEKYGIKMRKQGEVTLETEYDKVKDLGLEDWENVRGPRPWEESEQIKQ